MRFFYLYYTQPFYGTSTFGQNHAYCIRIFTVRIFLWNEVTIIVWCYLCRCAVDGSDKWLGSFYGKSVLWSVLYTCSVVCMQKIAEVYWMCLELNLNGWMVHDNVKQEAPLSWALANSRCVPNLKSLAPAVAEILYGNPKILGSSPSPRIWHFFLWV